MKFRLIEKRVLTEGTKYDKKAIAKLANSGLFDEETSANIVNALFKEDIHAFVHAPAWLEKYLIGIVNMLIKYCNGDASKAQKFLIDYVSTFEEYLTYVKDIRPKLSSNEQLELDKKFNEQMSIQDLEKELEDIRSKRDTESAEQLKKMDFSKESQFELIPIDSFSQFKHLFGGRATGDGSSDKYAGDGGTAWCHANSESTYNSWVDKGKNKFFVIANKNWENIPFDVKSNSINPKDAYGNSLIAILVNKRTGRLLKATLRCNHVGVPSSADNQYNTYAELSEIAGFNVEDAVKENLKDVLINIDTSKVSNKLFDGSRASLTKYCKALGIRREELTEFSIPEGITSIGASAFIDCSSLISVTIPSSVTKLGSQAFRNCESLTNITIPNSVTSIGSSAFFGCSSLTSIVIPDSVAYLGEDAFLACYMLTNLVLSNSLTSISSKAFCQCRNLTNVSIPNSVTHIGELAFLNCARLVNVTIPNSVTSIDDSTFEYCDNMVITCKEGSYAAKYASRHDIPVKLIESLDNKMRFKLVKKFNLEEGYSWIKTGDRFIIETTNGLENYIVKNTYDKDCKKYLNKYGRYIEVAIEDSDGDCSNSYDVEYNYLAHLHNNGKLKFI